MMSIESTVRAVEKQMYDFVCINDDERIDDIYPYKKALINAFENILPEKSGYEK